MKVAFFLLHYPVFSETFVSREFLNLQQLGVDGLIYCEKKIISPPFHPHLKQIKFPVSVITQKIIGGDFFPLVFSHFYWIFKNPLGYLKSLYLLFLFFNYHHLRVFIKAPLLAQQINRKKIDLIYVHEVDSPCLFGLICSRLCRLPCGIILHTNYLFAHNRYLSAKIKFSDFIIFQSLYSQKQAFSLTRLPQKYLSKCHVIFTPGVDTDFFKPNPKFIFPKQIKIISIGRLEKTKGFPILLRAIKYLSSKYPDIKLTILGGGSYHDRLSKYVSQNHLQKNISLLGPIGHTAEFRKLIQDHSFFVLASISDSQNDHDVHPNVIKEAMSTGLICITSRQGGIDEIISDTKNAFLVDKPTPKNIAAAIDLVQSLSLHQKKQISLSARNTILKYHRQKKVCTQLKNTFSRYLHEKK